MSHSTKLAVLKAGIIPPEVIPELRRWGMDLPEYVSPEPDTKTALENIRESVESHETVEMRVTDLDALRNYERDAKPGRLYYSVPDHTKPDGRKTTFADVTYIVDTIGHYLIPWTGEDLHDLILDEGTYLKPVGAPRVYFVDVSNFHYGERKAFIACTPAAKEPS